MIHERIDPNSDKNIMCLSRLAHIKRYLKTLEIIGKGNNVLDYGCGFGYGSKILSKENQVLGMDISDKAIEYAKKNYSDENINYSIGDLSNNGFSKQGLFDAITFFEVLEHIENPKMILQNFKKSLKNNGKLFVSVPNGNNAPDNNEHHVNTYTPKDLEELLISNGFDIKQKFGQYPLLGTLAHMAKKITGYESSTDKESGVIPKIIDSIPGLPHLFSNLYDCNLAVSTGRTIYFVAQVNEK